MSQEDLYIKASKVIESCQTLAQLQVAFNYTKLFLKKYPNFTSLLELIENKALNLQ